MNKASVFFSKQAVFSVGDTVQFYGSPAVIRFMSEFSLTLVQDGTKFVVSWELFIENQPENFKETLEVEKM